MAYYNRYGWFRTWPKKKPAVRRPVLRQKFGQTWWGEQWLKSLAHIDFDNRLPRGRSYANSGMVNNLAINGSLITALVDGSSPKPYTVKIEVPLLAETSREKLVTAVSKEPYLLARLLNRELPPELNDLAIKQGITLFPKTWKDLKMSCSCPDWAVPCKHIAAVIYLLAAEIDKNPFVFLNMKGVNWEKLNKETPSVEHAPVPLFETLLENPKLVKNIELAPLQLPDLSRIPGNNTHLIELLHPSPLFFNKDFKGMLIKAYASVAKYMLSIRDEDWPAERHPLQHVPLRLVIDTRTHFVKAVETPSKPKIEEISLAELIRLLLSTDEKMLEICHPCWQWLHATLLFNFRLIETGAFVPGIWQNGHEMFFIRWVPARQITALMPIMEQLIESMPGNLLFTRDFLTRNSKAKPLTISRLECFNQICHSFIQLSFHSVYSQQSLPDEWYDIQLPQDVILLFGSGASVPFSGFGKQEIPANIHQWLSVFSIPERPAIPVLQIEERKGNFSLQCLVKFKNDPLSPLVPLKSIFAPAFDPASRLALLKDLRVVASHVPVLEGLLEAKGKPGKPLSMPALNDLLRHTAPRLTLMGVSLLLPKSLSFLIRPKVKLRLDVPKGEQAVSFFSLTELLSYQWKVALGELEIDADEFLKLAQDAIGLVKIKDQYILLDENELARLQKDLQTCGKPSGVQLLQAAFSGYIPDGQVGIGPSLLKQLQDLQQVEAVNVPATLNGTLRPYQVRGYQWLLHNAKLGMGSILADDMGLGKTIQVLAYLLFCKQEGVLGKKKALVVMPTTLLSNWQKEIERFSPGLVVKTYYGSERKEDFSGAEVILTSYGVLRNDATKLAKLSFHVVLIDEAQNIKNHNSLQSKAVKRIKTGIRIALSGTPVENRLSEYWSIFDFTNPGYLGNYQFFQNHFSRPIQINNDQDRIGVFKRLTAPFIMRRLKTDKSIIADLPDKIETNLYSTLTASQAALYQGILDSALEKIESSEGIQRKALILTMMMALKQIGNHPVQYVKTGKLNAEDSGKMLLFLQIIGDILENNEKVLVFTQFKEMGNLLMQAVKANLNEEALFLHGSSSRSQRDEMVLNFQEKPANRVFILSLKAGGTGLNLTAASHVIHYDLWWNPAVETQASDRAYRIGQKKNVFVYRLINQGTLEEKIDAMIQQKKSLANLTVSSGETWLGKLSNEELRKLVLLE